MKAVCKREGCEQHVKRWGMVYCSMQCANFRGLHQCIDCGKTIDRRSQRCRPCADAAKGLKARNDEMMARIRELRTSGVTREAIAADVGVHAKTLGRILLQHKIPLSRSRVMHPGGISTGRELAPWATPERISYLLQAYPAGKGWIEVCQKLSLLPGPEIPHKAQLGDFCRKTLKLHRVNVQEVRRVNAWSNPAFSRLAKEKKVVASGIVRLPLREIYRHGIALHYEGKLSASRRYDVEAVCRELHRRDPQHQYRLINDNKGRPSL